MLLAGACFSIFNRTKAKVYAVTTPGTQYSQIDESGVILSAEKVSVLSTGEDYVEDYADEDYPFVKEFSGSEQVFINNDNTETSKKYYFKNIQNGTNEKYVIQNNSFVMLNNEKYKINDTTYYRNPNVASVSVNGQVTSLADAVLFTFGSYYLNQGSLSLADENNGAGLTYVNVRAWRNNNAINLPHIRTFGDNRNQDFAYIIPQKEGYEGYYRFEVDYFRADGTSDTQEFSFYLLFESTYKGVVEYSGSANTYTSQPTIDNAVMNNGGYRYYLGKQSSSVTQNDANYPTITFDYTKYSLSYTHTANGKLTSYSYRVDIQSNSGYRTANLICEIKSSGESRTVTYPMARYNPTSANNIVTIVLTEMGVYNFSYSYIYAGENAGNAPDINEFLTVPNTNEFLYIHGFELKYSKEGYLEAQMRYLSLSNNSNDMVDILIPNGYSKDTKPNLNSLGVVYTLENNSSARVGSVIEDQSLDASINSKLNLDDIVVIQNKNSTAVDETIIEKVKNINYVETNQGSLWLNSHDAFKLDKSFYLFNPASKVSVADNGDEVLGFNNQVTFNKPGYYLVFVKVDVNGFTDEDAEKIDYYQTFAFKYTADTVEIKMHTETIGADNEVEYTLLGANGYTNKNVRISWETPGVFERAISARYYSVVGQYPSKETLLKQTPVTLSNGQTLGIGITTGAKYLIELKSEGESAVYQMFTIDREDISGIGVYAVQRRSSTGSSIYEFMTDNTGDPIKLNTVSNSLSAVSWYDKPSGAEISVSYTVTPFVKDNDNLPQSVRDDNTSEVWFSNSYKLGTEIGPIDIEKATNSGIYYKDVLQRQGIYIFTFTDKAGNSCKYMFILDDTEGYFRIGDEMVTRSSLLYTNNVDVELATHKVIDVNNLIENTDIQKIIYLASQNASKQEFKSQASYYVSNENSNPDNISAINRLFTRYSGTYYLKVANSSLLAYDHTGVADANLSISNIDYNHRIRTIGQLNDDEYSSESTIRRLYLTSENQLVNNTNSIKSYIFIEVNKDNSLGMAFSSPDSFDDKTLSNATRLYTWSDISKASATSDNFVGFTWTIGEGKFEVESISYDFYTLNTNAENFDANDRYYYTSSNNHVSLYYNGAVFNGAKTYTDSNGNMKGFALLNVRNNQTWAGLYIITRKYKGSGVEDERQLTQKYYLIVDRYGIIEDMFIRGGAINLGLLEHETEFRGFDILNTIPLKFKYYENNGVTTIENEILYNLYLTSNKLPATVNVPVGKYYDGGNKGSTYYAGRLKFDLFFIDRANQLSTSDQLVKKLFSINEEESANILNYAGGYYAIDIATYLKKQSQDLANKFVRENNNVNWLCLPGDYVLRITDMVSGASGNHEKVIGFRISGPQLPTTDVYSVTKRELKVTDSIYSAEIINNQYVLTTSEEFVKVELPKYNVDSRSAQVDMNFLVVEMTRYGRTTSYINYQYSNIGGDYNLDVPSSVVENTANGRTIYLNTFLRDAQGNIRDIDTSERLSYKIKIRYKLSGLNNNTRYQNVYYYYDTNGQLQTYFENEYTVVIDRVAPTTNVTNLENSTEDKLLPFYKDENSMFVHDTYESNAGVFFVNQYKKYYENDRDESLLYAFNVNQNTAFDCNTDISTLYYRAYAEIEGIDLSLPKTDFSSYEKITYLTGRNTYGALFENTLFGQYIEVIEMDAAGNMTQYVILYGNKSSENNYYYDDLYISFDVSKLTDSGIAIVPEGFKIDLSTEQDRTETLTIFDITAVGLNSTVDKFYRIELTGINNGVNKAINTNGLTDFSVDGLGKVIQDMIKSAGQGNYTLRVYNRRMVQTFDINYYDKREALEPSNLVSNNGGQYVINLGGANEIKNGVMYYATEVIITNPSGSEIKFTCYPSEDYIYRDINGNPVSVIVLGNGEYPNGTYQVKLIDAFGIESTPYRFRTDGSSDFSSITFEGDNERNHYVYDAKYYGYTKATVNYDIAIYNVDITYSIGGFYNERVVDGVNTVQYSGVDIIKLDRENGTVKILPYYNADFEGALLEVVVRCMYNGNQENTYTVVLDTRVENVSLRDSNSASQDMSVYVNTAIEDTTYEITSSGTMSLVWTRESKPYFDYTYTLHETMLDGSVVSKSLNDVNRYIINTSSDSMGLYRFEIRVYTSDGYYLGNKVYVFSVKSVVNELYYVQTLDNKLVSSNSTFNFAELFDRNLSGLNIVDTNVWSNLGLPLGENGKYITPNLNSTLPLYIYNEPLRVVTAVDQGARPYQYTYSFNGYNFTIYRIAMNTYSIYLATLETVKTNELVTDVRINNGDNTITVDNANVLEFTVSGKKTNTVELLMTQVLNIRNVLTKKNNLVLEVSYNDKVVSMKELNSVDINNLRQASYKILGNGRYTFVIRDLSGNAHTFNTEFGLSREWIDVNVLREVIISMNGEAPVDNAYFNGSVVINVYNPQVYDGLVNISVTRNGTSRADDYRQSQNTYTFTKFGTYRVVFTANYAGMKLTKTVMFTIINPNEARETFDLSSIANYQIVKVLNNTGVDITKTFNSLINSNLGIGGTLIKYIDLVDYDYDTNLLGIVSGKNKFTITYLVEDDIYPSREVTFAFTLNNEKPNLECNIEAGKSTTKGFTIKYNPGIIYEQIGDAYIYINDKVIVEINENSTTEVMQYTIDQKVDGVGEYYVRVVSSSGIVHTGFKVEVTKPFNVWAIVVIVIVTVAVVSVTVVIIVLRNKMRIR